MALFCRLQGARGIVRPDMVAPAPDALAATMGRQMLLGLLRPTSPRLDGAPPPYGVKAVWRADHRPCAAIATGLNASDLAESDSASAMCLGLDEMRCAIAACLDDDRDLMALAHTNRAWRDSVAHGPAYQEVLRDLLFGPASGRKLARLKAPHSYLSVVTRLREVQQRPKAWLRADAEMQWVKRYLYDNESPALQRLGHYVAVSDSAKREFREHLPERVLMGCLVGFAWGLMVLVGAGGVALVIRDHKLAIEPYGLLPSAFVFVCVAYAVHAGRAELAELYPFEPGEAAQTFDVERKALAVALRPRSKSFEAA